jgi:hypothetical protein
VLITQQKSVNFEKGCASQFSQRRSNFEGSDSVLRSEAASMNQAAAEAENEQRPLIFGLPRAPLKQPEIFEERSTFSEKQRSDPTLLRRTAMTAEHPTSYSDLPDYQREGRSQGAEYLGGLKGISTLSVCLPDFETTMAELSDKRFDKWLADDNRNDSKSKNEATELKTFIRDEEKLRWRTDMTLLDRWTRRPEMNEVQWVPAGSDACSWLRLNPRFFQMSGSSVSSRGAGSHGSSDDEGDLDWNDPADRERLLSSKSMCRVRTRLLRP